MPNGKNKKLLDPDSAVSSYFDTLLSDEEPRSATRLESQGEVTEAAVLLRMPNLEADLKALAKAAPNKPDPEQTRAVEVTVIETPPAKPVVMNEKQAVGADTGQSVTDAQSEFPLQCLMFSVAGVDFSLPLIDMGGVLSWPDKMTLLPGAPNWFMGLLKYRDRNVRVVDTARLLRLERDDPEERGRHILVFAESNWAITCDRLGEVVRLEHEDVQWKSPNRKSLSLGTIRDSLALLLDPQKVLAYLDGVELPGKG